MEKILDTFYDYSSLAMEEDNILSHVACVKRLPAKSLALVCFKLTGRNIFSLLGLMQHRMPHSA